MFIRRHFALLLLTHWTLCASIELNTRFASYRSIVASSLKSCISKFFENSVNSLTECVKSSELDQCVGAFSYDLDDHINSPQSCKLVKATATESMDGCT